MPSVVIILLISQPAIVWAADKISEARLLECKAGFEQIFGTEVTEPIRRMPHGYWSKDTVAFWINEIRTTGLDVNSSSMQKYSRDELLAKGIPISSVSVVQSAKAFFDDWDAALEYAGQNVIKTRRYNKAIRWSTKKIVEEIKGLHSEGIKLNAYNLQQIDAAGHEVREYKLQNLYNSGNRYFGSWDDALRAAGLDPKQIRQNIDWNRDLILREIKYLHEKKVPLYRDYLQVQAAETLVEQDDVIYSYARLQVAANREFGSWDDALRAAGLDPRLIRRNVSWKKDIILREINRLKKLGYQMSPENIRRHHGDVVIETDDLIYSLSQLHRAARNHFGNWKNALKKVGLNTKAIREQTQKWTKDKIKAEIRWLHDKGLSVDGETITNWASEIRVKKNDMDYSLFQLYQASKYHFGNWPAAVKAAGVDYDQIRGNRGFRHLIHAEPQQGEWINNEFVVRLGEAPSTPEDIVDNLQISEIVRNVITADEGLSKRYWKGTLEYIDQNGDFDNISDFARFLTGYYKEDVSEKTANAILTELAANTNLQDLL